MSVPLIIADDFMHLFKGRTNAYGVTVLTGDKDSKGKALCKSWTEATELVDDAYLAHLNGERGLGLIPITEDSKCFFGVIDIDSYADNSHVLAIIHRHKFPLMPFRSKSGGLHLYLFFVEAVPAKDVVRVLRTFRKLLCLPEKTELFPKQTQSSAETIGSFINLPYFNYSNTERYAFSKEGKPLPIEVALDEAKRKQLSLEHVISFIDELPLNDAPPCLQAIYLTADTTSRNLYLFSLACYLKAKYGDDFESHLIEANLALLKPLPISEVNNIVQSHNKKAYPYKCGDTPLAELCDKSMCRSREYGASSGHVSDLTFGDLVQWKTDPPYYEWTINEKVLRFYDETDLINQTAFRKLCFREVHTVPVRLKDENWTRILNTALNNIVTRTLEEGDDVSPGALFKEHLVEFLTKRAMADTKEQLLVDKVYYDQEQDAYLFKPRNLIAFLVFQKQFRYFGQTEIHARLTQMGGFPIRTYCNAKNKNVRVWCVPKKGLTTYIETAQDEVPIDFTEEYKDEQF